MSGQDITESYFSGADDEESEVPNENKKIGVKKTDQCIPVPQCLPVVAQSAKSKAAQRQPFINSDGIDPNTLSPTYSMVSYCPFIGKCGFFPIIFDHLRTSQDERSSGMPVGKMRVKSKKRRRECKKPTLESKYVQTIEPYPDNNKIRQMEKSVAQVPISTQQKESKPREAEPVQSKPARVIEPQPKQLVVFTQDSDESLCDEEFFEEIIVIPFQEQCIEQPQTTVVTNTKSTKKKKVATEDLRNRGGNKNVEPEESLFAVRKVETTGVNLQLVREESNVAFRNRNQLDSGISGLKIFVETRSRMFDSAKTEPMDFIDYFVQNDGGKYIGVLEQLYVKYLQKVQSEILFGVDKTQHLKKRSDEAYAKISEFYKITQVELEKQLQDYDFPTVLENDISKFRIEYLNKVGNVGKMHNYGVKMILYWLRLLETKQKPIDPTRIYKVATELMAEIIVLCYSLFVRIAEFLARLAEDPSEEEVQKYTLMHLTRCFRNLIDCICDEMGAIGESCGQVMIRIPNLTRREVVETMTSLYMQINYADVSISRAMEAMTPIIHLYYIRYFIEELKPKRSR